MIVTTIIVMKALIAKNVYIAIPFESINVRPTNTSGRMKNMPAIYTIANHLCRAVNFPNFFDKGIGILKILEKILRKLLLQKEFLILNVLFCVNLDQSGFRKLHYSSLKWIDFLAPV